MNSAQPEEKASELPGDTLPPTDEKEGGKHLWEQQHV